MSEKKGMTQDEYNLRDTNPYDLLQVHFLLEQSENSTPTLSPESVDPYDLMDFHSFIQKFDKK